MPMGQEVLKERRGAKSSDAGAFALAIIMSDRDTQMRLHMGGSPPFAVWLNGDFVWDGQFLRGYHPSSDRILITLHKGENHILVFSNWVFFISLSQVE